MVSRPTAPTASTEKAGIAQASSLAADGSRNVLHQNSVAKYPSPPTHSATPSRWTSSVPSARLLQARVAALWLTNASLTSKRTVRLSAIVQNHVRPPETH